MGKASMRGSERGPLRSFDRGRTFDSEAERCFRDILERDVIRNDVAVEMLVNGRSSLRLSVEKKMIVGAQYVNVSQNSALRVKKECVKPFARSHLLHVIRSHCVQQARAIFAGHENTAPARKIKESGAVHQRVISGCHDDKPRNTADKATMMMPLMATPVSCRERLGLSGRAARMAAANT